MGGLRIHYFEAFCRAALLCVVVVAAAGWGGGGWRRSLSTVSSAATGVVLLRGITRKIAADVMPALLLLRFA